MLTTEDTVTLSYTHVGGTEPRTHELDISLLAGPEQVAVPDVKVEETDDWEHGPINPRNWSPFKKWTATSLVGTCLSSPCFL